MRSASSSNPWTRRGRCGELDNAFAGGVWAARIKILPPQTLNKQADDRQSSARTPFDGKRDFCVRDDAPETSSNAIQKNSAEREWRSVKKRGRPKAPRFVFK